MAQSEFHTAEATADLVLGEGLLDSQEGTWTDAPQEEAPVAPFGRAKSMALVVGFAFVWAAMVWAIQHMTTAPTLWKEPLMLIKDHIFRFLLNWTAATVCFSLLSTRTLGVLFAINMWVATAVISFFVNYQRALSWVTITNQSGEGMAVALVALEDAAPYLLLLIPLGVVLLMMNHRFQPRIGKQKRLAAIAAGTWLVVFLGVHFDHKPLHRLERFESADGIAHTYGFATTWIAESYYVSYDGITEDAMKRLEKPVDRLSNVVPPVEMGDRLAVIQVESLDDALVGLELQGEQVIPRLNEWAQKGSYLRVQAPKKNGSCDSDFALLYGALPSARMAPYRIPGFPFDRSLANALHDRGWTTSAFHNVNGTFFERRTAFEAMDFDRIIFREELIAELNIEDPEWTIEDGKMFRYATSNRANDDRFFEFTITGTSHTPFRFSLEDWERQFFPDAHDRNYTYFDTIAYVDDALGQYVDGLPLGTTVVIYGDHWSRVLNEEINYESQLVDEFGIVPAILFRKTEAGIQPLFEVDSGLAKSAKLRLADMTAWLRKSLNVPPAYEPLATSSKG